MTQENSIKKYRRKLNGVVIRNGNDKTIVVNVTRRMKHKTYKRFVTKTKRYHAHDESNKANIGDKVTIIESKPYSKLKRWGLVSIN